jgi:hypothetical protein
MAGMNVLRLVIAVVGVLLLIYVAAPIVWECVKGATCQ